MARKTARKATKGLRKGKKLEKQTTLTKGQPVEYLKIKMTDVLISG
ncbi:MAG TPA: hypothetical protein VLY23_11010 [Candidatus Acidoferrum sp.]|nr:hypothetical protein [Candidatus Acidoferrum sp.]